MRANALIHTAQVITNMKPTNPKNQPTRGMKLHKFIATGGNPKDFNKVNGTEALRASSKGQGENKK